MTVEIEKRKGKKWREKEDGTQSTVVFSRRSQKERIAITEDAFREHQEPDGGNGGKLVNVKGRRSNFKHTGMTNYNVDPFQPVSSAAF